MLLAALIARQNNSESLTTFQALKVDQFVPAERPIIETIRQHVTQHGVLPTRKTLQTLGIVLPDADEPLGYYLQRFWDRAKYQTMVTDHPALVSALRAQDIPAAVQVLAHMHERVQAISASGPSAPTLPVLTGADLRAVTQAAVPWIVRGYLARGALTLLDGKPKIGKSTFVAAMVRVILAGEVFIDTPATQTGVLWITEETLTTFRGLLARTSLLTADGDLWPRLHVLPRSRIFGKPWAEIMVAARAYAVQHNLGVLVLDTLSRLAGLGPKEENDAGVMGRVFDELDAAAADDLAIFATRHERKSGGEAGEAARGSGAGTGGGSIILSFRRPDGSGAHPTRRLLDSGGSRFDETPTTPQIFDWEAPRYLPRGPSAAVCGQTAEAAILAAIAAGPADGLTEAGIKAHVVGESVARTIVESKLRQLVDDGMLIRTGTGARGDSYRYRLPADGWNT